MPPSQLWNWTVPSTILAALLHAWQFLLLVILVAISSFQFYHSDVYVQKWKEAIPSEPHNWKVVWEEVLFIGWLMYMHQNSSVWPCLASMCTSTAAEGMGSPVITMGKYKSIKTWYVTSSKYHSQSTTIKQLSISISFTATTICTWEEN